MRTRLGFLALVGAITFTACGSDDAPDKDWAMSLCKRMVNHGYEDDAGNPVKPMAVLRARPISVKDAAKLPGNNAVDEQGFGEQTDGYLASCKVKWIDPDIVSKVPLSKDAAVLVSESGDTAFIVDRF